MVIFPALKWVSKRIVGNWITHLRDVGEAMDVLYGRMVFRVKKRRLKDGSQGSFLDGVLDQQEKLSLNQNELQFLRGVMMEVGSDTWSFMILAFLHAMINFPEVQRKAQEEGARGN